MYCSRASLSLLARSDSDVEGSCGWGLLGSGSSFTGSMVSEGSSLLAGQLGRTSGWAFVWLGPSGAGSERTRVRVLSLVHDTRSATNVIPLIKMGPLS